MRILKAAGLIVSAALVAAACVSNRGIESQVTAVAPAANPSLDPRVKFKDGERYLRDLSESLVMPRATICRELGQYDCFTDAFRIVLGGVEGPNLLVHQPLEVEALTAPIAYDRVALNVCTSRVGLDTEIPAEAVLFLPDGKTGRKPSVKWLNATADRIYESILRRAPSPGERASLVKFYDEVASSKSTANAASDWTILGCFAAATSLEAIFY